MFLAFTFLADPATLAPPQQLIMLAELPSCIVAQIASHLSRADALVLATTCQALQHEAERRAWRRLTLATSPCLDQSDSHPHPLYKLISVRRRLVSATVFKQMRARARAIATLVDLHRSLRLALSGSDTRRLAVRDLEIDDDCDVGEERRKLLALVAPTLVRLRLSPPVGGTGELGSTVSFHGLPLFANLRHLSLPLGPDWEASVLQVMSRTPHLKHLHLYGSQPFAGGWGRVGEFRPASAATAWPVCSNLRTLRIDDTGAELAPLVMALVRHAPRLQCVTIGDPARLWPSIVREDLHEALGVSKQFLHVQN